MNIIDGELTLWLILTGILAVGFTLREITKTIKYNREAKKKREEMRRQWRTGTDARIADHI